MTTVYDPVDWPDFGGDPRRTVLLQWLEDNGLNPDDFPLNQQVRVRDTVRGREIWAVVFTRDEDTGEQRDSPHGPVIKALVVPLAVEPPAELVGGDRGA